ncbi:hypothetical protein [Planococcus alpniumensis]|uniref:hypothetical protein n=1 Tax=Planococcus alpniumensis TaxID=2708345 RepID=UPI001B8AF1DB|nr:hypothetical protein [Planococcus sp. MSAK28401]
MEIHVIGKTDNKKNRLKVLLSQHYPQHTIVNQETVSVLKNIHHRQNIALLVILLNKENTETVEQLLQIKNLEIPILCVEEEETDSRERLLNGSLTKGYIRRNAPLEKIKSAMNLVLDGGIYKEPTSLTRKNEQVSNHKELEMEWTILSMHSKGFSFEEMSEVVELPINEIEKKLTQIKKTIIVPAPSSTLI